MSRHRQKKYTSFVSLIRQNAFTKQLDFKAWEWRLALWPQFETWDLIEGRWIEEWDSVRGELALYFTFVFRWFEIYWSPILMCVCVRVRVVAWGHVCARVSMWFMYEWEWRVGLDCSIIHCVPFFYCIWTTEFPYRGNKVYPRRRQKLTERANEWRKMKSCQQRSVINSFCFWTFGLDQPPLNGRIWYHALRIKVQLNTPSCMSSRAAG